MTLEQGKIFVKIDPSCKTNPTLVKINVRNGFKYYVCVYMYVRVVLFDRKHIFELLAYGF